MHRDLFVENFPGIVFQGDGNFKPTFLGGRIEEITGYGIRDFVAGGVEWHELIYPEDLSDVMEDVERFKASSEKMTEREYRIVDQRAHLNRNLRF